jgi:molybdopterin/thiamine biosynthesis adenylyltransferase/rhodanese-related sulfurtransferase
MKITEEQLYKRQTTLKEVGKQGQQKLLQTHVVVIGCGGLGSAAAVYLAASGVGNIHLVDYDVVDTSNLHRQVFYTTNDIDKSKVSILANHIATISPFVKLIITNKAIDKENVIDVISNVHYVLDCTDSLPIKYLINDACVIKGIPLIYGSLYKFDGYVASFNIKISEKSYSANLRDAFPEISKEAIPNCSEIGTLNTIVGIIGVMQANEVLKMVIGSGKALVNQLLIYNSLENSQYKMKLKNTFTKEKIQRIFDAEIYLDHSCEVQDESLLISAKTLRQKLLFGEASQKLHIISVIENNNAKHPFQVHQKIPLSKFRTSELHFDKNNEYVIVCNKGVSSYIAIQKIKAVHPDLNVLSLKNGITNY